MSTETCKRPHCELLAHMKGNIGVWMCLAETGNGQRTFPPPSLSAITSSSLCTLVSGKIKNGVLHLYSLPSNSKHQSRSTPGNAT